MTRSLPDSLLSEFSDYVAVQMGLHFPPERWDDLEKGICSSAREFGAADVESCANRLLTTPLTRKEIEVLASELTIGETYFFRENRSFDVIRNRILPELIRARQGEERRIRVWSAGCCTGEEPYSIAILLDQLLPYSQDWQVTILGTDINPRFLEKAVHGVFGEWSFRDTPAWLREIYFKPAGDHRFEIIDRIKEKVTFDHLNLAGDTYPSLFNNTNATDLILCRNVLMYFTPQQARKVVHNLHQTLREDGWLVVSATETSDELFSPFVRVSLDGLTFYQKGDRVQRSEAPPARTIVNRIPPADVVERITATVTQDFASMARASANLGELDEARVWAEKAIAADKLNANLHHLHAMILEEQGSVDEASNALKRALYLSPDFVLAHFEMGNLARRQRRFNDADKHFENAARLLAGYQPDDIVPESDGLTAGRLVEIIHGYFALKTPHEHPTQPTH